MPLPIIRTKLHRPPIDGAHLHREHLLEKISELDLEVMELVLEKKEVPEGVIKAAIRRICLERSGFPVLMGSAFKRKGVQNLLDAIVDYLPSPADMGGVVGRRGQIVHDGIQ